MTAKHPPTYDCVPCNKSFHAPFALEDHYRGSQNHPNCVRCGRGFLDIAAREEVCFSSHLFPPLLLLKLATAPQSCSSQIALWPMWRHSDLRRCSTTALF